MNGVEILNTTYEYARLIDPKWLVLCLILLLITVFVGAITVDFDVAQAICAGSLVILIIGVVVCFFGMLTETDTVVGVKYDVVISDEVPMNEFLNKYEIIEQNGKIYTVEEIE